MGTDPLNNAGEDKLHPDLQKLTALGSLVPARMIHYHLKNTGCHQLESFSEEYEGAVLFADISGFSSLAEKLAKDLQCAANAAENLSSYIGKSLEKMVHTVCSRGGDVIKFAGDALLAVFPSEKFHNNLEEATLCCVKVALDLLELELMAGGVELSVHCGVGAGRVVSYHVGGKHNRWEYVITGDPVDQIGSAEPEAEAGEVVIAETAHGIIASHCHGTRLESGNFKIDKLTDFGEVPEHPLVFSEFQALLGNEPELARMKKILRCYVPRPVLQAIDSGQSLWFSELRLCSTLFCKIKGLQFNSSDDLALIQEAVVNVQDKIYLYEGTLCRFIVDDKGAGLLLAFGLPPYMHENDPVRATKSALEIHAVIQQLVNTRGENLGCSIGVTSGRVFCGTTGGGIRCEYTLHGTLVNLAARYMVAAKEGVLCGEVTYRESKDYVLYEEPILLTVKGKKEEVRVYRPIEPKRVQGFASSFIKEPIVGRKSEKLIITQTFDALRTNAQSQELIVLIGEAGIGKSRLMQRAYQTAQRNQLDVLLGIGVDTEQASQLFVFRSIFTQLLHLYYKRAIRLRLHEYIEFHKPAETPKLESRESPVVLGTVGETSVAQQPPEAAAVPEQKRFPSGIQVISPELTEAFFEKMIDMCHEKKKDLKLEESSEKLLRYMGMVGEDDDNGDALPEPPRFDKLPAELQLAVVKDMIPGGKDATIRDLYPLLHVVLPKVVDAKDNDKTEKIKKELRAENLLILVKEMFSHSLEQLEQVRKAEALSAAKNDSNLNNNRTTNDGSSTAAEEGSAAVRGSNGASDHAQPAQGTRSLSVGTAGTAGTTRSLSVGTDGSELQKSERSESRALNQGEEMSAGGEPNSPNTGDDSLPGGQQPSKRNSYLMRSKDSKPGHSSCAEVYDNRIVMLIEDAQFIDPLSMRLLEHLTRVADPLATIISTRQTEGLPFTTENMQILKLENLSREEVREGMCRWLGVKNIPDKALSAVMEKSGGHPLFAGELAKLMEAEKMIIVEGKSCKLSKKAQEGKFGLPDTISALMTSKLDRLPPSQQLMLKVAAVIGNEFRKYELVALMPRTDNEGEKEGERNARISDDIASLVNAGLLIRDPSLVHFYRFTNAMLRESAYNLLLFQRRKDFHQILAEFYEERNKEYLEPWYFVLATNYYLAEVHDKTVYYSEIAGDDALEMHAMQQVLICFSRLLELDAKDPDCTAHIPLERKVGWNRKVGEALLFLGKSADAEESFLAALEILDLKQTTAPPNSKKEGKPAKGIFGFFSKPKAPPLVGKLPAFQKMKANKDCGLMLEAANTFELLGKLNTDRNSPAALCYRLNALELAISAQTFAKEQVNSEAHTSSDELHEENINEADILEIATAKVARSYAYAAVFYICIGNPKNESTARFYTSKCSQEVVAVKDSETQALVHFKCSEFAAMVGDFKEANDRVRKTLWVSKFLNFERLQLDAQELNVFISTSLGSLGKAKSALQGAVNSMNVSAPNYVVLAMYARVSLFVGDFDSAERALERIGRLEAGSFAKDFSACAAILLKSDMPETLLALSLLLVRKYNKNDQALMAAIRGTELLQSQNLDHLPLVSFHTAAFLLSAFAECLAGVPLKRRKKGVASRQRDHRLSFSQVVPYDESLTAQTSKQIRRNSRKHLQSVMHLLKLYAKVYRPCKPHYIYCTGLYAKILDGKTNVRIFLQAAKEAELAKTTYIQALGLFEAGLVKEEHLPAANAAFRNCMENSHRSSAPPTTVAANGSASPVLSPDAPYELRLLEGEEFLS